MRNPMLCLLAVILGCALSAGVAAASSGPASGLKLLKRQQKIARKQLKMQEKIWKKSFHGRRVPRAERLEEKHQFQRNMRSLREQQKDHIQEIKDQQRLLNYQRSHPLY
ncbi:MAG: hypothetical protein ACRD11_04085 [Terriglobia bacterium]